jgi:cytochrome b561
MPELPSHPDTGATPDRRPAAGGPRWKSVIGVAVAVVLIALFLVLHLTGVLGPGEH